MEQICCEKRTLYVRWTKKINEKNRTHCKSTSFAFFISQNVQKVHKRWACIHSYRTGNSKQIYFFYFSLICPFRFSFPECSPFVNYISLKRSHHSQEIRGATLWADLNGTLNTSERDFRFVFISHPVGVSVQHHTCCSFSIFSFYILFISYFDVDQQNKRRKAVEKVNQIAHINWTFHLLQIAKRRFRNA